MNFKDKAHALLSAFLAAAAALFRNIGAFLGRQPQMPLRGGFGLGVIVCLLGFLIFLFTHGDAERPTYQLVAPVPLRAATPLAADGTPLPPVTARVSVLVLRVGQSRSLTNLIIDTLPPAVDIGISPYATDMAATVSAAENKGHAAWVELAMQSRKPNVDNGPLAVTMRNTQEQNLKLVDTQLARARNVRRVIVPPDAALPTQSQVWANFAYIMTDRGFQIFDATEIPVKSNLYLKKTRDGADAYFNSDFIVDGNAGPQALDASFAAIEAELKKEPHLVVVLDNPTTLSIRKIAEWLAQLPRKGFALQPVLEADEDSATPAANEQSPAPAAEPAPPATPVATAPAAAFPASGQAHEAPSQTPSVSPHPPAH